MLRSLKNLPNGPLAGDNGPFGRVLLHRMAALDGNPRDRLKEVQGEATMATEVWQEKDATQAVNPLDRFEAVSTWPVYSYYGDFPLVLPIAGCKG